MTGKYPGERYTVTRVERSFDDLGEITPDALNEPGYVDRRMNELRQRDAYEQEKRWAETVVENARRRARQQWDTATDLMRWLSPTEVGRLWPHAADMAWMLRSGVAVYGWMEDSSLLHAGEAG